MPTNLKIKIKEFKAAQSGFFSPGGKAITLMISNISDIELACRYIYIDKHVLFKSRKGAQKYSIRKTPSFESIRDSELKLLAKEVHNYFLTTPFSKRFDYNNWHDELCKKFLSYLNDLSAKVTGEIYSYGNAQKMINILFKYLRCFDDYHLYKKYFVYCHLPVDNYVLDYLANKKGIACTKIEYYGHQYKGKHWWELNDKTYKDLQNEVLSIYGKSANLLHIDFDIWKKI